MKQLLIIISLSIILFTNYGCKKKAGLFAPEFVCKVDGEKFKPKKTNIKSRPIEITIYSDTLLLINARNEESSLFIGVEDKKGIGNINYTLFPGRGIGTYVNLKEFTIEYETDSSHIGSFKILNIDFNKKKLSAHFEYVAFNKSKNKTVKITDGKINASFTYNQ